MATTTTAPKLKTHVGERIRRTEDPRLITGTACYLDDITRPGMLHAAVLRSPYAAARINSISIEDALALPGVKAVYVGKDVESVGGVPCAGSMPDLRIPNHKILAGDRVYYVGHPVAAVVATDKYIAADAIERIEVDYEPTELVSDPEEALQEGAVKVHPEYPDNVAFTFSQEGGDVEEAFRQADVIVKEKILVPRLAPLPIETRGVVAEYDEGAQELTIYSSTQIPHLLRTQLALQLNLPEHHVRVIAPEVGGGFGSKCNVWAEEALAAFVAMELKQPVKWVESRRESILVVAHGRAHVDTLELAAKNDGTLLGLKLHILCDIGAHHQLLTPIIPTLAVLMLPGLYKFRSFKADLIGAFTNRAPSDLYRGAGRPEATYVIERMVDKLAAEIGMDPAEIRFKNFPASTDFPFNSATGLQYDSGDYATAFNKALDIVDYKARRAEQEAARAEGRLYGIGISTYGEICAFGPSPATPAGGWESASVNVEATGKVAVMTGISPHGQGEETSFAQLTADALGIPMDDIVVVHGDTAKVHYGIGTFGSRGISIGGSALHLALQDVVAKATKYAAHMMGVDAETVTFEGGVFSSEATDSTLTLADVALEAHLCRQLPPGTEPGLAATRFFEPSNFAFPFGAHICVTEVDKETGEVDIQRFVAVDDCGRIINPLLVEGQIHGGIAQGLGPAFQEGVIYDDEGQLLNGTLMDYSIPKARNMPWIETDRTETPSPVNPLGTKGVGEAGTIGSLPAFVNSVVDALSPLGIEHIDIPMTSQSIWNAIHERSRT
ncbi:MAG: xanthine dehydrogenase family protein molybdopterin-binding subunit [Bryobacterales bacterium]|nr:xanthine dehydrogenase family protein molybdopterin-binding subunit [Bryobacterales bacterium]MDE0296282.1 xanthine dehydrogenase family protein molybdopterin-binding subunit [Bryobacterales bacterium]